MNGRKRRVKSIHIKLLDQSREAALNAVQTFNNPLTTFKTEAFIVLMVIAWMYLLHAYYRKSGIDYRYYKKKKSVGTMIVPNLEPINIGNWNDA